ncbi:protein MpC2H2-19 [Marchantia polymorpha subsp. ruderalis]
MPSVAMGLTFTGPFNFHSRLWRDRIDVSHASAVKLHYGNGGFPRLRGRGSPGSWVRCGLEAGGMAREEEEEVVHEQGISRRTVAVFWDLDNKPPNTVPPYDAALRLKTLAGELGEVVDMVAYANRNAFTHVPARVREERHDRKLLDQLERRGLVEVEQPYICSMCGRKCKTNYALKKHFKQLHERERQKRMNHLDTLKGKKRVKFLGKVVEKEVKYKEAARTIIVPKVGYGLATELKRAGVMVRTVESRPQAADEALIQHMTLYINRGLDCLFLVSDDSDFLEILRYAKSRRLYTVVIGDTHILRRAADASFLWEDVASGKALQTARDTFQRWVAEDVLREELQNQYEDEEDEEDGVWYSDSEDGYLYEDGDADAYYENDANEEDYDSESSGEEEYQSSFSPSQGKSL